MNRWTLLALTTLAAIAWCAIPILILYTNGTRP